MSLAKAVFRFLPHSSVFCSCGFRGTKTGVQEHLKTCDYEGLKVSSKEKLLQVSTLASILLGKLFSGIYGKVSPSL